MELTEFVFGKTALQTPLKAQRSNNFYNEKWLYIIAGIHSEEIEAIYFATELINWFKESSALNFPCIIIPVLDIDGYTYPNQGRGKKANLNHHFPASILRSSELKKTIVSFDELRPEISSLINLLREYPPQVVINLRTASSSPKIVSIGEESFGVGRFLSKSTGHQLIADNQPGGGTLEAFIYDFFLSPVATIRLPHYTSKKTVKEIYQENIKGLQQLFLGQIY